MMSPQDKARKVGETLFAVDIASKDTMGMELLSCEPGRAVMRMPVQPLHLNVDDREDLPRKLAYVLARRKPPLDFFELSGAGVRIPHCFPTGFTLGSVLRITLLELKKLPLREPL